MDSCHSSFFLYDKARKRLPGPVSKLWGIVMSEGCDEGSSSPAPVL